MSRRPRQQWGNAMIHRIAAASAILAAAALAACSPNAPPAAGASSASTGADGIRRTSWGEPNLEGLYTNKDEFGTPFERPNDLAGPRSEYGPEKMADLMKDRTARGKAIAASIGGSAENDTGAGPPHWYEYLDAINGRPWYVSEPADGKVPPLTEEGKHAPKPRAKPSQRATSPDTYTDLGLYQRCITIGLPGSMMPMIYGNAYSITQSPGVVAIRYEMVHETRVIPTDGSAHLGADDRLLHGRRARALGRRHARRRDDEHPRGVRLSQRERELEDHRALQAGRRGHGELDVRFEDPATWTGPWAIEMPLKRKADAAPFEYACHEGNRGLQDILSAARAGERNAGAAPKH